MMLSRLTGLRRSRPLSTPAVTGVAVVVAVVASLALLLLPASAAQAASTWSVAHVSSSSASALSNAVISDGYAAWIEQGPGSYDLYLRDLSSGTNTLVATQTTTGDPYVGDGYLVWGTGDGVYLYDIDAGTPGSPLKISPQSGGGATVDGGYVVWHHTEGQYHDTVWMYNIQSGVTTSLSQREASDVWPRIEDGYVIWQSQTIDTHTWQLYLYDIQGATAEVLADVYYPNCTGEDQGAQIDAGRVVWIGPDGGDDLQVWVHDIAQDETAQVTTDAYEHQYADLAGDWVTYRTVKSTTPGAESDEIWLHNLQTLSSTRVCLTTSSTSYLIASQRPRVDVSGNVVWERNWYKLPDYSQPGWEIMFFDPVTGETSYITPQYVPGNPPDDLPMFPAIDAGKVLFWSQTDFGIYLATRSLYYGVTYAGIRGTDRYDTAIKISQAKFPSVLPFDCGVVLAPGETFQEALCGAPLASAYGGPVLLTYKTALANNVKAELQRLAPTHVFCIGMAPAVLTQVQAALPSTILHPLGGANVYAMSRNVANALKARLYDMSGMTAIVTVGTNFPDAIGVSPLACSNLWPIILTDKADGSVLHADARGALTDLGIHQAIKVGTYATLPGGVTGLANLSGADRYATNRNVAVWAKTYAGLGFNRTGFATGDKFPDALAAGPYLGIDGGILLLSPLYGPLPPVIGATVTANRADVRHVTFIACIEPVIGQVKALLPDPPVVTDVQPGVGPAAGGTAVIISGTKFTGVTAVQFGAAPAAGFTVVSDTRIDATSPAGSGTVDVTVTGPTGTSLTGLADRFRYTSLPVVTTLDPISGSTLGGTVVTITGTNLSGATAVAFGATPAAHFSVDSSTQIRATSPAHAAGMVDVTVTTPGGTSATATTADDYLFDPTPEITGLSPTWGPEAGGTSVTITGANFTGATAVKFGDTDATGFTVVSGTEITATAPPHAAGPVHVSVTTADGTNAPSAADQFRFGSPVRYEQDDPLIAYSGDWTTEAFSTVSAGTMAWTVTAGSRMRAAFVGTSIEWIGRKGIGYGLATLSIDGGAPITVDLSNPTLLNQQVIWSSGPLTEGLHTVAIVCACQPGAAGTGLKVGVDAFDIVGELVELPPEDSRDGLLVFDGQSLTTGYGSTPGNDYPSRVVADLSVPTAGSWIKRVVASGGQTVADLAADAATEIDVLYSSGYFDNICVVWEGCISISKDYSAVQLHDELKAYCQARRAAGFKVVLLTVLPFGADPAKEVTRSAANALIRADWTDYADALADVALDHRIGDAGDQYDPAYYLPDLWHPIDAGYAIVADIVRAAIESIL